MKVLNKQRKEQLANSKFGNYLKYALGEILLVAVGILLAVAVNNWNEDRQNFKELESIHAMVKKNLVSNIAAIDKILEIYASSEVYYQKHLDAEVTQEDYQNSPGLAYLIMGYPELTLNQRGYRLLQNFTANYDQQENVISGEIIGFYTEMLHEIKVDDELRANNFQKNFSHWQTYPWWSDYISQKDYTGFIDYALNDQDYKNRIATAEFINYKVFKKEIEEYKQKAQALIDLIQ
ncbi:MAG: hypothetical protein HKN88_08220 [Gammaproteobacteria bacterium]|nr:hypothetical protein [Gammaproteobacteria bacterium]